MAEEHDPFDNEAPERPLECSECKKPITIHYSKIEKEQCTRTAMCDDCPELQRRLQGSATEGHSHQVEGLEAGLTCGDCGITLQIVRTGHQLGCSHCYEVFGNAITLELHARHKLPPVSQPHTKSIPLHIGRAPGEVTEVNPSLQLIALNEALSEMLKREDYEQAALIRDQINALTEQEGEHDSKPSQ